MSLEINKFEFGDFLLEAKEKVLQRDGKPLSITPKSLELHLFLVKDHGPPVEKDELMKAVWADSFVEVDNWLSRFGYCEKSRTMTLKTRAVSKPFPNAAIALSPS